jgi:hypothetical protein
VAFSRERLERLLERPLKPKEPSPKAIDKYGVRRNFDLLFPNAVQSESLLIDKMIPI